MRKWCYVLLHTLGAGFGVRVEGFGFQSLGFSVGSSETFVF